MRFYRSAAMNEMNTLTVYFQENIERALRPKIARSKHHMLMGELNKSFERIKAESLANVFNELKLVLQK